MMSIRRVCIAVISCIVFIGDVSPNGAAEPPVPLSVTDKDRAEATANGAELSAVGPSIAPQMASQFSAMKLKDPAAQWIVTIAVANDIADVKPGDIVDFLVLKPEDRADDAADKGRERGDPDPQLPSTEQILRSLSGRDGPFGEVAREDVRIVVERVVDRLGEPRFFPMVGMAQHHRQEFKCTVHSRKTTRSDWPIPFNRVEQAIEIVHIDRDHLMAAVAGKPVVENVQVVGATTDCTGRQNGDRLIVAVTPLQVIRLRSAKLSGTVFVRLRRQ
jgi:hypothetical protein